LEVLQSVRKGNTNKSAVTFAILNGNSSTRTAFGMGASFVLQKPITTASALRCFSAAHGAMVRERRRYFRVPVEAPVTVHYGQGGEVRVTAYNLSEGGMAIRSATPLPATISKVNFTVPGTNLVLEPRAEVAWSDGAGQAGIRFHDLPQNAQEKLERWVAERLESATRPRKGSAPRG
jgi:c-di-GMP-binding flagellar brake protein YcgR